MLKEEAEQLKKRQVVYSPTNKWRVLKADDKDSALWIWLQDDHGKNEVMSEDNLDQFALRPFECLRKHPDEICLGDKFQHGDLVFEVMAFDDSMHADCESDSSDSNDDRKFQRDILLVDKINEYARR